jgi:ammonium transporter, Amt family
MDEIRGSVDLLYVTSTSASSAIKDVWLLICTILVMSMQGGFLLLEAGSVRSKNTINVAQKNLTDFFLCGAFFFIIGGPIMFGASFAGSAGLLGFGGYDLADSQTRLLFLFQFAFCATAATVISGAVAERMTFVTYVVVTICMASLIYPLFGHLAWGDALIAGNAAFLRDLGFLDYAGSTVVHTIAGAASLAALLVLGPRHNRFDANGKPITIRGHSTVLSIFGTMILMFGWVGFNAGAADPSTGLVSKIALNTVLAMTFGGCAGMAYDMLRSKGKTHPRVSVNGIMGGCVAVTAGCAYFDTQAAVICGVLGGLFVVMLADILLHKFKIDDAIDAVAVHGGAGILGTLLVALLADEQYLAGSRLDQLGIQLTGSLIAVTFAFSSIWIVLKLLAKVMNVRVTVLEEELGLNLVEHDDDFDISAAKAVTAMKPEKNILAKQIGEEIDDLNHDSDGQIGALKNLIDGATAATAFAKQSQEEIVNLATRDQLTGLYNRVAFKEQVNEAALRDTAADDGFALLYIDLDGFKSVNDGFGHAVGDQVLQIVSSRLQEAAGEDAIAARFGGDEFVVKVPRNKASQPDVWKNLSSEIISAVSEKMCLDSLEIYVGASVGVALYPEHDRRLDDLILKSDMALYEAKESGKGKWVVFNSEMEQRALRRKELELDMRTGIAQDQFTVEYQPQVSITEGQLVGFEALMRWEHPVHGFIAPHEFIPIAEETGLIVELSERLIMTACTDAVAWPKVKGNALTVAVNISPVQFARSDVHGRLAEILVQTGLDPICLEIEVTEGMLISNMKETKETLEKLRALGVQIAIDDFGTGYSSLTYLQEFPIDRLKVDRSFIQEIENSASDQRIAKAIVDLGKSLGLSVIAEGVETEGQRKYLETLKCDQIQGFIYSPPVSLIKTLALITRANSSSGEVFGEPNNEVFPSSEQAI